VSTSYNDKFSENISDDFMGGLMKKQKQSLDGEQEQESGAIEQYSVEKLSVPVFPVTVPTGARGMGLLQDSNDEDTSNVTFSGKLFIRMLFFRSIFFYVIGRYPYF
jgi:hypothetical protein